MERILNVFHSFDDADRADDEYYARLSPQQRLDLLLELIERHRRALATLQSDSSESRASSPSRRWTIDRSPEQAAEVRL
ncbi:MAG: hypothetical protein IPK07_24965 [Deltaproteobacteria bacterium]|nr:hypothetical protein [Deltaproteobacteria bacterium]